MELNKYYTPISEEFNTSFLWELKDDDKWVTMGGYPTDLIQLLSNNKVRVKYLTQEDIESFGFILKGKAIDLWFERKEIYLRDDGHHLQNIKLQYGKHDQRLKITFHYTAGEEQIHFEGIIKNKSELRKLMKQLQINE